MSRLCATRFARLRTNRANDALPVKRMLERLIYDKEDCMLKPQCKIYEKSEAIMQILAEDDFLNNFSNTDFSFRLKKKTYVVDDFRTLLISSVLGWTTEDKIKLNYCFNKAINYYGDFSKFIPNIIVFVKLNGMEEPGNAYCRNYNTIIIHPSALDREIQSLTRLLVHELFHIISRNNLNLKEQLYNLIGFFKYNRANFPNSISETLITNPDYPINEYIFRAKLNNSIYDVYPILYATEFESMNHETIKAKFIDIKTLNIYEMEEIENYTDCIGNNTDYTIQPEEIIAENITKMLLNEKVNKMELINKICLIMKNALTTAST